jgi:5-methylcytosine-specific restriction endonuclease McrA
VDAALRAALYRRTHGYCDVCGGPMAEEAMATHHRLTRRRGGDWRLSNLLGIHHRCHNGDTASVHLSPLKATLSGYLVPTGHDPRLAAVLLHGARWVTLHDDGTVVDVPEEG